MVAIVPREGERGRDHIEVSQHRWRGRKRETAGRSNDPTRQHPRHELLPLKKGETMLTHSIPHSLRSPIGATSLLITFDAMCSRYQKSYLWGASIAKPRNIR